MILFPCGQNNMFWSLLSGYERDKSLILLFIIVYKKEPLIIWGHSFVMSFSHLLKLVFKVQFRSSFTSGYANNVCIWSVHALTEKCHMFLNFYKESLINKIWTLFIGTRDISFINFFYYFQRISFASISKVHFVKI